MKYVFAFFSSVSIGVAVAIMVPDKILVGPLITGGLIFFFATLDSIINKKG